jgi:hypothetical protein
MNSFVYSFRPEQNKKNGVSKKHITIWCEESLRQIVYVMQLIKKKQY